MGFQQVSESLPAPSTQFVGKIPEPPQSVTRYAAGIPTGTRHSSEAAKARQWLQFLPRPKPPPTSPEPISTR